MPLATFSAFSWCSEEMTTLAPSAASRPEVADPMPPAPPNSSTVVPRSPSIFFLPFAPGAGLGRALHGGH